MIRVIDHKKLDLTNDEFILYEKICKSYDSPTFKGSDLFKNLFETNEHGIITFLRPPTTSYTSMEVWMFLVAVMIHQHIGSAINESDRISAENKKQVASFIEKTQSDLSSIRKEIESFCLEGRESLDKNKSFLKETGKIPDLHKLLPQVTSVVKKSDTIFNELGKLKQDLSTSLNDYNQFKTESDQFKQSINDNICQFISLNNETKELNENNNSILNELKLIKEQLVKDIDTWQLAREEALLAITEEQAKLERITTQLQDEKIQNETFCLELRDLVEQNKALLKDLKNKGKK